MTEWGALRHTPVMHEFQCRWNVYAVKDGRVTWRCRVCGRSDFKQVRLYGILPVQYLLVRKSR